MKEKTRARVESAVSVLIEATLLLGVGYLYLRCMGAIVLWLGL